MKADYKIVEMKDAPKHIKDLSQDIREIIIGHYNLNKHQLPMDELLSGIASALTTSLAQFFTSVIGNNMTDEDIDDFTSQTKNSLKDSLIRIKKHREEKE